MVKSKPIKSKIKESSKVKAPKNLPRVASLRGELLDLPYIGQSSVEALSGIGIKTLSQFKKANPEKMYEKCCKAQNTKINRAFLYVLRGAHYFAHHPEIPKKEIKWWLFRSVDG